MANGMGLAKDPRITYGSTRNVGNLGSKLKWSQRHCATAQASKKGKRGGLLRSKAKFGGIVCRAVERSELKVKNFRFKWLIGVSLQLLVFSR